MEQKKIKVVIVDDIQVMRLGLKSALTQESNIEVIGDFHCSNKLYDFLNDKTVENPDIILLDMAMQGGTTEGVQVTEKIKSDERFRNIEIIIFSGLFDYPTSLKNEEEKNLKIIENYNVIANAINAGAKGFISRNVENHFNEDISRAIRCITRGEDYFFNAPVLQTVVKVFLQYAKHKPLVDSKKKAKELGLDPIIDIKHILMLAKGLTASEISVQLLQNTNSKKEDYSEKGIEVRKSNIAKKLNIINKTSVIVVKAIQEGLISVNDIEIQKVE
jgi:DNA-binding NarL/FixJ family response regulator